MHCPVRTSHSLTERSSEPRQQEDRFNRGQPGTVAEDQNPLGALMDSMDFTSFLSQNCHLIHRITAKHVDKQVEECVPDTSISEADWDWGQSLQSSGCCHGAAQQRSSL